MKEVRGIVIVGSILILLIFTIIIGINLNYVPKAKVPIKDTTETMVTVDTTTIFYKYDIDSNEYYALLDTIKYYEGLSLTPYIQNNSTYIGYGTKLGRQYLSPINNIDTTIAECMLYEDINYAIEQANTITNLKGNKLLAIADFIHNVGIGNYIGSSLAHHVQYKSDTLLIKQALYRWSYYNGRINSRLAHRRQFEYNLYCK